MSQNEIAKKVGKARTTITNSLRLLKLPIEIKNSLKNGVIQAGHARAILKLKDTNAVKKIKNLFYRTINENLSVRQVEKIALKLINNSQISKNNIAKKSKKYLQILEEKLRNILGTKVKIEQNKDGLGKITIDLLSKDDLGRILEIISNLE